MRLVIFSSALLFAASPAFAQPPTKVYCEGGRWPGVGIYVNTEGQIEADEDGTTLPDTLYTVLSDRAAVMTASQRDTPARVVNTYSRYVTLSYVYGGVHYTDTLYDNGLVLSQNAKISIIGQPSGTIFYKVCKVLG